MGRPEVKIDWNIVDELCHIQCTSEEIASVIGCSDATLARRCKKDHDITFAEYIAQKSLGGKSSLRRKQWKAADSGNTTMLIWLGKQYLGQVDKPEDTGGESPSLNINFSVKQPVGDITVTNADT